MPDSGAVFALVKRRKGLYMEPSKEIGPDDLFAGVKVTVTWKLIDGKKNAVKIVEESAFDTKKETH